jgi:hypothetical protein
MLQTPLPDRLRKVWQEFDGQANKKTGETSREQRSAVASTLGLLDKYLMDDPLAGVLSHRRNTIDLPGLLDTGHVICCNLAENVPPRQVRLLGNLLMASVVSEALTRSTRPDTPYWLIAADEFDQLAGDFFSFSIEKLRAAHIVPLMSHQSTVQLSDRLLTAVSGADIKLFFQIAPADISPLYSKVIRDKQVVADLERLPRYNAMLAVEGNDEQVAWLPPLADSTRWHRLELPDWWAPFDQQQFETVRDRMTQPSIEESAHERIALAETETAPDSSRSKPGQTLSVGADRAASGPGHPAESEPLPMAAQRPGRRATVFRPAWTEQATDHGRDSTG